LKFGGESSLILAVPTGAKLSGLCPRCGARLELAPLATPHAQRCEACGSSFLAVLPEPATDAEASEASGAPLEVLLLPHGEGRNLRSWLEARGILRPWWSVMRASGAALVALIALLVLALLFPGAASAAARIAVPVGIVLALPLTALLSRGVVRLTLGRAEPDLRSSWRATLAVACGVTALAMGPFVWPLLFSWLPPGRAWLVPVMVLIGVPPGILVSRLVRARPYHHGFAVVLTFTLGCLLVTLPVGTRAMAAALLFASLQLPLVLLGARLGMGLAPVKAPPSPG
jgi:hypothetical protein